ncbi:MAG: glycosyl hydrolase-related protein [Armatimonadetes bacterium]|nr:glycosyl hydrolase-related protein [Armatimonadota bacterium]
MVHVVPETHWDREYYMPFQCFRRRLVKMCDKLLAILDADPGYRFVFDGQTVVLEDYAEIRPQMREKLAEHIRSGRLLVGPGYICPDEWLVSAEALVRNFLLGHLTAENYGRVMKAGYLPDPFGHISQLPQILAGFGIDNVLFMRGLGDREWLAAGEKTEFWWAAPDGTKILAIFLKESYCNAMLLGWRGDWWAEEPVADVELAIEQARARLASLTPFATTRHILFNNGCDNTMPQPDLSRVVATLNAATPEAEFRISTYEEYVESVRHETPELATVTGEFHGAKFWQILSGILSSRMYLKLANERCQALLEKYTEPLQAWAWVEGAEYEAALLWHAWRHVLRNHAHDSIGGCSGDQVHSEMVSRFDQAEQVAEILASEAATYIGRKLAVRVPDVPSNAPYAKMVVVYNPSSWRRCEVVGLCTSAPLPRDSVPPQLIVRDADGQPVPAQIANSRLGESRHPHPAGMNTWEFEALWIADVPPLGFRAYSVACGAAPKWQTDLRAGETWLANEFLHVTTAADGNIFLTDRRTGQQYGPLNVFEDREDAGDEYDWSWAPAGQTLTSAGQPASVSLVEKGPVRATLRIDRAFTVPAQLAPGRQHRSDETTELRLSTLLSLTCRSPRLDFETTVHNAARDHRLRVLFCAPVRIERCQVQAHFDVVERDLAPPEAIDWVQPPQPTHCTKGFVDLTDGEKGLGVLTFGLPEYEVKDWAEGKAVAVTLLRCCVWLGRHDHPARGYIVGPKFETPGAQCLGTYTFRYSVVPHSGTWLDAGLWHHAEAIRAPLKPFELPLAERDGPGETGYLELRPQTMVVTAIKKAEQSEDLVVRFVNIGTCEEEAVLTFGRPLTCARLANLNEEPLAEVGFAGRELRVPVRKRQIVTVPVRFTH